MPRYQPGFGVDDYDRMRDAVLSYAATVESFNASDALGHLLEARVTNNAGDCAQMLDDLTDLEHLERVPGEPPRWRVRRSGSVEA